MLSHHLIVALSLTAQAYSYTPCPILGQSWEPPTDLAEASEFKDALASLQSALENTTSTGVTDYGTWSPTNNSFSLGVFDATTPGQLFTFQHSSEALQNAEQGAKEVTEDTIFRIGSNSKLITVYLFLVKVGPKYWNRLVTDFVPRLKKAAGDCSAEDAPIDCIDWEGVTLGALASHMAGLPRDYSTFAEILSPLNGPPETAVSVGFPPLPASAAPSCGLADVGCSKGPFLDGFSAEHPRFAPFTTPLYSNGAFAVLAIALENITGRKFEEMLTADLFAPLNMTGSSYRKAKSVDSSAIPPGSELVFNADTKASTPGAGMFSTQADLARMGQSILSSKLLSPVVTRQWLKPTSFTSSITQAVGMPWEIYKVPDLTDHLFDLYSKAGDILSYSSYIVLSPDYNVGFSVVVAGNQTTSTAEQLMNTLTAIVFPAVAKTAKKQVDTKYSGIYKANDSSLNATLTISTEPENPGLVISDWISNGTSINVFLAAVYGAASDVDIRLYPTGLVEEVSPTRKRVGYKASFARKNQEPDGGVFDSICTSWIQPARIYGNVGLDEFVFEVVDGEVVSVEPRAFRVVLEKQ